MTEREAIRPGPTENESNPDASMDGTTKLEKLAVSLSEYDVGSPESSYLRSHQRIAVGNFVEHATAITDGTTPNRGMAILHPTGSGKTVTVTEILRIATSGEEGERPKALMLVPGHSIMGQVVGSEENVGAVSKFAPGISVTEYSGRRKDISGDVVVMTYQALPWAITKGVVDEIDPTLVVCDEAHHIIDGKWAEAVAETVKEDRMLVGLTATPAYSDSRNVSALFPIVLDKKTMGEGISEGMLAELRGFVYKGSARLNVSRRGKDYEEEEIFASLIDSEDNYLAAKICASEVMQGRRGVVSCTPGYDRAHAKIVAEILKNTDVTTIEGTRKIRAEFVDGTIHPDRLDEIFENYRTGKLDVITYVNLLLEGWDSPETDFTVLLRPTISRVLAEQRLGRVIRSRDGKVATVHEIVYEMIGDTVPQYTHLDVIQENKAKVTGGTNTTKHDLDAHRRYNQEGPLHIFSPDQFAFDDELAARVREFDSVPIDEIRIICGQETIPIHWLEEQFLAARFDMEIEELRKTLEAGGVAGRVEEVGDSERRYYPSRSNLVLAEHNNIPVLPETHHTVQDLLRIHKKRGLYRRVTRRMIVKALEEEGVAGGVYFTEEGSVVEAYPPESSDIPPITAVSDDVPNKKPSKYQKGESSATVKTANEVLGWIHDILVNPGTAPTGYMKQQILTAQNCLLKGVELIPKASPEELSAIKTELSELGIDSQELSERLKNLMKARSIDIYGLVFSGRFALNSLEIIKTRNYSRRKD